MRKMLYVFHIHKVQNVYILVYIFLVFNSLEGKPFDNCQMSRKIFQLSLISWNILYNIPTEHFELCSVVYNARINEC
jgi:hypothetical protein